MKYTLKVACNTLKSSWRAVSLYSALSTLLLAPLITLRADDAPMTNKPTPSDPVRERLIVLTFDDSVASHATFVAPMLKEHGFGATFFITEGFELAHSRINSKKDLI